MKKANVIKWIEDHRSEFITLSDEIWHVPEISFKEFQSSYLQAKFLEERGWKITWDIGGLNTAFIAEWGKGKPKLGFFGEFDALPGLSQAVSPDPSPIDGCDAGHGCGHNLMGVGCLAAAMATRAYLEATGKSATIRYYGCPAEEDGNGKVIMATAGVYKDLDAAFNFHPWSVNRPAKSTSVAVNDVKLTFHGRSSHAGGAPHLGRSALDAIELTHIGLNYLREHVTPNVRMHYSMLKGGDAPNIVPALAQDWMYLRAPTRQEVNEVTERVLKIARGAALMTETELEVDLTVGSTNINNNHYLADLHYENMRVIGPIEYDKEEMAFAAKIGENNPPVNTKQFYENLRYPPEMEKEVAKKRGQPLLGLNFPAMDENDVMTGSTDVGDLSWMVPVTMMRIATWPVSVSGHTWGATAASGMSIGHKGLLHAAKVMALTAIDLIEEPAHLKKIRAEFNARVKATPYHLPEPHQIKRRDFHNPVRNTD